MEYLFINIEDGLYRFSVGTISIVLDNSDNDHSLLLNIIINDIEKQQIYADYLFNKGFERFDINEILTIINTN